VSRLGSDPNRDGYGRDMSVIDVERLAGSCGAIVRGIDVTTPKSPDEIEAILQLLDEHLVIALPNQQMDLDRLEAFTDELGGRDVTPYVTAVDGRPYVIRVIKEPSDELNFANAWHTDLSYLAAPPAYTVLHAHDVPVAGGDTMWANQHLAYETLPDGVKEQIADLRATHSAGMAYGTGGYLEAVAGKSSMKVEPSPDAYATETHPLVIRHPRTGRSALYANSVYTTGIEGMEPDEARTLLARLTAHATHPNFTCRLRWEPRMLTIWDNSATQHFAINDYPGARRELFRTSVAGTEPQPA
jgi:alpha-ketoglutarate-dependent taurine dioxygenase